MRAARMRKCGELAAGKKPRASGRARPGAMLPCRVQTSLAIGMLGGSVLGLFFSELASSSDVQPLLPFSQQQQAVTKKLPTLSCAAADEGKGAGKRPLLSKQPFYSAAEPLTIDADRAIVKNKNQLDLSGHVLIQNTLSRLQAEEVSYLQREQQFFAEKNIRFSRKDLRVTGIRAKYNSRTQVGQIEQSKYQLPLRPAQGVASRLDFQPGEIELEQPSFSTCPAVAEDWVIKADNMVLHTRAGYGEGEDVTFYFKDIPFLYTPYLRFPLNDERQSGFLLPEVGYSSRRGLDISTPYYWNIAPNMDATLSPRVLSQRGFMLGGEFRYLDRQQYGEVYAEYLQDRDYDQWRTPQEVSLRGDSISERRGAFSLVHRAKLSDKWHSNIDFNYVSDNYYLDDFGNNLKDRSVNHLLRDANIQYTDRGLKFMARVQGYQELRINTHTYSRLPQLVLSGYKRFGFLGAGFKSEAVDFVRNWQYNATVNEGQRYYLKPYIDLPLLRQYGFIKPRFSLDALHYQLDQTRSGIDRQSTRVLPIFSIDSGLFFDRDVTLLGGDFLQTLEPRLYYLYVPYTEQLSQPVFDTSYNSFSFSQLFRENRFSSIDRLGDANQLSLALTSRLVDNTNGYERLRASIGEILYFRDRKVRLNADDAIATTASSSIAAELASQFHSYWNTSLSLLYDPHQNTVDNATFRLQYKADNYHLANFDYTYRADGSKTQNYQQLDFSTYWQLRPGWRAMARWNYSLQDDFNLETLVGLEYDSCCYALRLAVGREQAYLTDEANYRVMLQFHFKGLASVGNISDRSLRADIRGFEATMSE